jgi:hypothetical protein
MYKVRTMRAARCAKNVKRHDMSRQAARAAELGGAKSGPFPWPTDDEARDKDINRMHCAACGLAFVYVQSRRQGSLHSIQATVCRPSLSAAEQQKDGRRGFHRKTMRKIRCAWCRSVAVASSPGWSGCSQHLQEQEQPPPPFVQEQREC